MLFSAVQLDILTFVKVCGGLLAEELSFLALHCGLKAWMLLLDWNLNCFESKETELAAFDFYSGK